MDTRKATKKENFLLSSKCFPCSEAFALPTWTLTWRMSCPGQKCSWMTRLSFTNQRRKGIMQYSYCSRPARHLPNLFPEYHPTHLKKDWTNDKYTQNERHKLLCDITLVMSVLWESTFRKSLCGKRYVSKIQNESTVLNNNIILNSEAALRSGASSGNVTGKEGHGFHFINCIHSQTDLRSPDV